VVGVKPTNMKQQQQQQLLLLLLLFKLVANDNLLCVKVGGWWIHSYHMRMYILCM
jgi:hypothetical protein